MSQSDKPLVWLHGEVKTPPLSQPARLEAGCLLRRLQKGKMQQEYDRDFADLGFRTLP